MFGVWLGTLAFDQLNETIQVIVRAKLAVKWRVKDHNFKNKVKIKGKEFFLIFRLAGQLREL
jgi:hypothetical protein